jgi:hypothetical protein
MAWRHSTDRFRLVSLTARHLGRGTATRSPSFRPPIAIGTTAATSGTFRARRFFNVSTKTYCFASSRTLTRD